MFKKTFIRVIVIGTILCVSFFLFISANKASGPVQEDCTGKSDCTESKKETINSQGESIWETFVSTVLIETN